MRTFRASGGTVFNHNGDFSGDVYITPAPGGPVGIPMTVPAYDLLEFAAEYVRRKRIEAAEAAKPHELLGPWSL